MFHCVNQTPGEGALGNLLFENFSIKMGQLFC